MRTVPKTTDATEFRRIEPVDPVFIGTYLATLHGVYTMRYCGGASKKGFASLINL